MKWPAVVSGLTTLLRERFSPAVYVPTTIALAWFHAAPLTQTDVAPLFSWAGGAALTLALLEFLFLLRCYDEIKDFIDDVVNKPWRPLPRGVLTHLVMRHVVIYLGCSFLIFSWTLAFMNPWSRNPWWTSSVMATLAWLWSIAMYNEFGIGGWLRPRLTRYALSHTAVMVPLSLWMTLQIHAIAWTTPLAWARAIGIWCLFNFFEFSRKTFGHSEERNEPTYSNRFGIFGAVALGATQIIGALTFFFWGNWEAIEHEPVVMLLVGSFLIPASLLLTYGANTTRGLWAGKLYRAWGSAFLLFLLIVLPLHSFR